MQNNSVAELGEYFIRYNKTYNEFSEDTEKWGLYDTTIKDFAINPKTEPYLNMFLSYNTYTDKTKQYYVVRSYLEHLETIGGGTLTLEAGTYNITNSLYVPSNVTIKLKDGVIIKKEDDTGVKDFPFATPLFILAAPSKSRIEGAYGGYDGDSNINILGEGKAIIDLNFVEDALGIVLGHNTDVTITGITFQNMYSGHFIELDASMNVIIEKNIFKNHKPSLSGIKEAINVDTPDVTTEGFNHVWTKHDCTPNKDIYIRNNTFEDVAKPIQIMPWKNNDAGSQYDITYNDVTYDDFILMQDNTLIRVREKFIRYNKTYNVFDKDTERYYIY